MEGYLIFFNYFMKSPFSLIFCDNILKKYYSLKTFVGEWKIREWGGGLFRLLQAIVSFISK